MSTFLLVGLLAACGSNGEGSVEKASADKEATTKDKKSDVYSGKELEKYNAYVEFSNAVNSEFLEAQSQYFQDYSDENGKYKKPGNDFYPPLRGVSLTKSSIDTVNKFVDKSPSFAVDKEAKKLVKDLEADTKTLTELSDYYTSKGYIDDNFKKAESLHNDLLKSSETTNKDIKSFNEKMSKIIDKQQQAAAKEMKDAGELTIYNVNNFISQTEKLITTLQSKGINASNVLDTDLAAYEEAYNQFTKSYDELVKASTDEKQLKKEKLTENDLSGIMNSAKTTKADASSLLNRLKKKEAISQTELENPSFINTVEGTPEKLMDSYNELVTDYNSFINFH
ncbi:YiiG family protein [Listeria sp. FSL L7-0091]|uniref:YiiG family protein n=1 Tax=Listeria farberi TaxID=2713500 RepID=A0A7X1DDK6_9LIST|nr:DUF3829 domain-containing protein [Listeria farberi]MBC1374742.1 YiiG family protein [Listeria farberi]MBC1380670.1 YiiG family protein [Listeria farberi]MBC2260985.1 YiiG family protein [Listeria farberi]MBC2266903.1 YiiG family protein [Listeria farberi]MBC2286356.1 YiiG family protein [Listeria farberi]